MSPCSRAPRRWTLVVVVLTFTPPCVADETATAAAETATDTATYAEMHKKAEEAFSASDFDGAMQLYSKCMMMVSAPEPPATMSRDEADQEFNKLYAKMEQIRLNIYLKSDEPSARNFSATPPPKDPPPLTPVEKLTPSDALMATKKLARVYVTPLLSEEECALIVAEAELVGDWKERLAYNTREVNFLQMRTSLAWFKQPAGLKGRIFELLRRQFGLKSSVSLTLKNSNVIRYDADDNETSFVQLHSDGKSRFTFNVLLNDPSDFTGGGTRLPHLQQEVAPKRGFMITYYGGAFHSGERVSKGRRYVWQGFVDVASGTLKSEEQMNVLLIRNALSVNPNLPDAYTDLARSLEKLGRAREEVEAYEGALRAGHHQAHLLHARIGATQHREGQDDLARRSLEEALRLAPDDRVVLSVAESIVRDQKRSRELWDEL